jgi:Zn-dependent protease
MTNPADLLIIILYLALLWVILFPITTFLHECGHAFTALALTDRDVKILLGDGRKGLKWQRGRLGVVLGWFTGFVGFTRYNQEEIAPHRILWITLVGPLVSLLLTLLFWVLTSIWNESGWFVSVMKTLSYATFAQFLFTILPWRYPRWFPGYGGRTSDGWRILEILRRKEPVS